ncbi:MAG: DUF5317 family protein [Candidatus Dormibacterales bacterium]
MLWLIAFVLGVAAGLLTGGRIDNFARLRFRWPVAVIAAVFIREAVLVTPLNRVDGAQWAYAGALAAIVVWTAWHLDRLPGIWLVTLGAALNLAVILANGARMPVARAMAGELIQRNQIGQYTLMGPGTQLGFLADWISLRWLPGAYSPGDLVTAAGLFLIGLLVARRRPDSNRDSKPWPAL